MIEQYLPLEKPDFSLPGGDRIKFTWIGHGTFSFEVDGKSLLIDPFITLADFPRTTYNPTGFLIHFLPQEIQLYLFCSIMLNSA